MKPAKSLIICAEYRSEWKLGFAPNGARKLVVDYKNVTLFGQSKEEPNITCITAGFYLNNSCYEDLIKEAKRRYCSYFKTDEFNICTVEYLVNLDQIK